MVCATLASFASSIALEHVEMTNYWIAVDRMVDFDRMVPFSQPLPCTYFNCQTCANNISHVLKLHLYNKMVEQQS